MSEDRQCSSCGGFCKKSGCERENIEPTPDPIYTAPPQREWMEQERAVGYREGHQAALKQREWVGLTDEEIEEVGGPFPFYSNEWCDSDYVDFARAIEAKLREKNG